MPRPLAFGVGRQHGSLGDIDIRSLTGSFAMCALWRRWEAAAALPISGPGRSARLPQMSLATGSRRAGTDFGPRCDAGDFGPAAAPAEGTVLWKRRPAPAVPTSALPSRATARACEREEEAWTAGGEDDLVALRERPRPWTDSLHTGRFRRSGCRPGVQLPGVGRCHLSPGPSSGLCDRR